jgi:protein-disulfide isomerase
MKKIPARNETIKIIIAAVLLAAGIIIGFAIGAWGIGFKGTTAYQTAKMTASSTPAAGYQTKSPDEILVASTNFSADLKTLEIVNGVSVDGAPTMGDTQESKVIIVEFSDYQCLFCKKYFDESFSKIRETYVNTNKVIYAFRDYPLTAHPQALLASNAANCANDQGKFWEMHDLLFERQDQWSYKDNAKDIMLNFAKELKLDMEKFNNCLNTQKYLVKIQQHIGDGLKYKVTGTPTFFINNKKVMGAQSFETLSGIIDGEYNRPRPKNGTRETMQIEAIN